MSSDFGSAGVLIQWPTRIQSSVSCIKLHDNDYVLTHKRIECVEDVFTLSVNVKSLNLSTF